MLPAVNRRIFRLMAMVGWLGWLLCCSPATAGETAPSSFTLQWHKATHEQLTQLDLIFGETIPECLRACNVRLVNLRSGNPDFFLLPVSRELINYFPRIVYGDHLLSPDFVGFLFRLKPF